MENNLKYKTPFLVVAIGILTQLVILPYFELHAMKPELVSTYYFIKSFIAVFFISLIFFLKTKRFVGAWKILFHVGCFAYILSGQFFHPGYQYAVIEFMFICAIIFEGFPLMSTMAMVIFIFEYYYIQLGRTSISDYPLYHYILINALLSSWIISVALEHYVNRFKHKQNFLDRKLRYKGIKTDLLLHDLKNKLQPLIFEYSEEPGFKEILKTIQSFNSFQEDHAVTFEEVVTATNTKFKLGLDIQVSGDEDFFIDQLDLQTIFSNLLANSKKASEQKGIVTQINIYNDQSGFTYEDNAGGMTDEQLKYFSQKDIKPYPGHEKNGLGLLLIKKLVEHQGGQLRIKRISGGTRFEIAY